MSSKFELDMMSQLRFYKNKVLEYENGTAYQKLEEKYEKTIWRLEDQLDREKNKNEKLRSSLADANKNLKNTEAEMETEKEKTRILSQNNQRLTKRIACLENENRELRQQIRKLEDEKKKSDKEKSSEIRRLQKQNQKLSDKYDDLQKKFKNEQARKQADNTNSSSTARHSGKKIPNSRKKTSRKPGAQKGHQGHRRPDLPANRTTILPEPEEVRKNPDLFQEVTAKRKSRKSVGIRVELDVEEFVCRCWKNKKTGRLVYSEFPEEIRNEINYDPSLRAFMFLLVQQCNVSIDKASEFTEALSGGLLKVSKGWVNRQLRVFSEQTEKERQEIYESLIRGEWMNSDTTYIHLNGKIAYYQICANGEYVLYQFRGKKGKEVLEGTPAACFSGILIHDHDRIYYDLPLIGGHQECLAHLIRYCQGAEDEGQNLKWPLAVKAFLQEIIHLRNQNLLETESQIQEVKERYYQLMDEAVLEYAQREINVYNRTGYNLLMRLINYSEQTLYFLDHPEIEPTNNEAERDARASKRWEKCSGGHRGEEQAKYRGDALSVLGTLKKQNKNVYEETVRIFSRT